MNPKDPKQLEAFIDATLKRLPERQAPATLEHRVLAAIAARQALAWYHRPFRHWPLAAQASFLGLVLALASLPFLGSGQVGAELPAQVGGLLRPVQVVLNALSAVCGAVANSIKAIPSVWLQAALAGVALLYISLLGLGATAYKTLIANR